MSALSKTATGGQQHFFFRPLFTVLFALPSHKVEGGIYTPFVKMDLKIASPSFPEVQEKNESFYLRFC